MNSPTSIHHGVPIYLFAILAIFFFFNFPFFATKILRDCVIYSIRNTNKRNRTDVPFIFSVRLIITRRDVYTPVNMVVTLQIEFDNRMKRSEKIYALYNTNVSRKCFIYFLSNFHFEFSVHAFRRS